jgi:hypothetical protein
VEHETHIPEGFCKCRCGGRTRFVNGKFNAFIVGHGNRKPTRYIEEDRGWHTPCWICQFARNPNGYAYCWNGTKVAPAHRVEYERHRGAIPPKQTVDHLCEVKECVNPDHLEVVSLEENLRRAGMCRLTEADVRAIRASKEHQHVLGKRFNVCQGHISRIKGRKAWKGVV